MKLNKSIIK